MAIRKLGPAGSETTLPSIAKALPVTIMKKVETPEMSDGSLMAVFFKGHRVWNNIRFPKITKSQLDDLIYLRSLDQVLRWQNPDESDTWYDVAITAFKYDTLDSKSPTVYYFASMSLEEIG